MRFSNVLLRRLVIMRRSQYWMIHHILDANDNKQNAVSILYK